VLDVCSTSARRASSSSQLHRVNGVSLKRGILPTVSLRRLRSDGFQVADRPRPQSTTESLLSTNHGGVAIISVSGVRLSVINLGVDLSSFEFRWVLIQKRDVSDYIETGSCSCKITSAVDLPLFRCCGKRFLHFYCNVDDDFTLESLLTLNYGRSMIYCRSIYCLHVACCLEPTAYRL